MLGGPEGPESIEITIEPRAGIRRRCSRCQKPAPGYDCLPQRRWLFVPLWGSLDTTNIYARANVEAKRKALKKVDGAARSSKLPRWKREVELMAWLDSL
jgi:hypothetical protein